MSSKAFVFHCLLLAFVLLLSSEVAARDLVETSSKNDNKATVETNGIDHGVYVGYGRSEYERPTYGNYGGGPGGYDDRSVYRRGCSNIYRCRSGDSKDVDEVVEGTKH